MTIDSEVLLKSYLDQDKLPPALLFVGDDVEQMQACAQSFALEIMTRLSPNDSHKTKLESKNHPDYYLLEPSSVGGYYQIENIRFICEQSHLYPHESSKQFFVVKYAELMQEPAANALLKTLEEPTDASIFILIVQNKDLLLPTIVSRVQQVHFSIDKYISKQSETQKILQDLLNSWPHFNYEDIYNCCSAIQSLIDKKKDENFHRTKESYDLLLLIEKWRQDLLVKKNEMVLDDRHFSKAIESAKLGLDRHIKCSICFENLLLKLMK